MKKERAYMLLLKEGRPLFEWVQLGISRETTQERYKYASNLQ